MIKDAKLETIKKFEKHIYVDDNGILKISILIFLNISLNVD